MKTNISRRHFLASAAVGSMGFAASKGQTVASAAPGAATAATVRVPVILSTDLMHPHDDPDDHFDLATLYAMPEMDIKGVVLD